MNSVNVFHEQCLDLAKYQGILLYAIGITKTRSINDQHASRHTLIRLDEILGHLRSHRLGWVFADFIYNFVSECVVSLHTHDIGDQSV
jgi:hypothetical protein